MTKKVILFLVVVVLPLIHGYGPSCLSDNGTGRPDVVWAQQCSENQLARLSPAIVGGSVPTGAPACTTPTGDEFTESFGDASTSCWSGGPSTCNGTWTVYTGSGWSIVASPGTPPDDTACTNSFQLSYADATTAALIYRGMAAEKAANVNIDIKFELYVDSATLGTPGDTVSFMFLYNGALSASSLAVSLYNAGGVFSLLAMSGASNTSIAISVDTWYAVWVHMDATAANSYLKVDSTQQNFTRDANGSQYMVLGVDGGSAGTAMNIKIGYSTITTP